MSDADAPAAPTEEEVKGETGDEVVASASGNPLTAEIIGKNLSMLCKTGDGVAHAYVRLDVPQKELTDIDSIKTFKHVRYLDISKNKVKDLSPIGSLSEILVVNASGNEIESLSSLPDRRYLQVANFSNNKLTSIDGLNFQKIEIMNMANNEIEDLSNFKCDALSALRVMDLCGNKLSSTSGLHLPSLESLYVGKNQISSLADVGTLKNLETLHARGNKLESLSELAEDGPPKLKYLNLRENNITTKEEVAKLSALPALETLILLDNPVREVEDYRIEILVQIPSLLRLDKDVYTEDEIAEAAQIRQDRKQELEADQNKDGKDK